MEIGNGDREICGVHRLRHGNFPPVEARRSHIDRHVVFAGAAACEHTARSIQIDVIRLMFGHQQPGDAARGIAAGFDFAAVRIEDTHECRGGICPLLHHNDLIAADAPFPVGNRACNSGRHRHREDAAVKNGKIIA